MMKLIWMYIATANIVLVIIIVIIIIIAIIISYSGLIDEMNFDVMLLLSTCCQATGNSGP